MRGGEGRGELKGAVVMFLKVRVIAHMPNLSLYSHIAKANIQKVGISKVQP